MSRDFDAELRDLARRKSEVDDSIVRRIDTGVKVLRSLYGLIVVIVIMAIFIFTLRYDLNQVAKDRERDTKLINQLYKKVFGYEVAF